MMPIEVEDQEAAKYLATLAAPIANSLISSAKLMVTLLSGHTMDCEHGPGIALYALETAFVNLLAEHMIGKGGTSDADVDEALAGMKADLTTIIAAKLQARKAMN